jgi:EAL domain-containing protein (putative c-di-GMP-specific phosphodiesterase class I)
MPQQDRVSHDELRRALDEDQIVIHLQPQVHLSTQQTRGFEALMRWQHPTLGLLAPDRFLPLALETGLAVELGTQVVHRACKYIVDIQHGWPAGEPLPWLAVNLSAVELVDPALVHMVAHALDQTALEPDLLWIELTETAFVHDLEAATRTVEVLRSLGAHLAIDDFGTGWSSLSHLRHLPVEALKIDRSFVAGLGQATDDTKIVSAVVALAHSLGIATIAEGVEHDQQRLDLLALGCDLGQGYLWSRAVPADDLVQTPGVRRPAHRPVLASTSMVPPLRPVTTASPHHHVEFWDSDEFLAGSVAEYLLPCLDAGGAAFVIATDVHERQIEAALTAAGCNVGAVRRDGRFLAMDTDAAIASLVVDGRLDRDWFERHLGTLVASLGASDRPVRVYCEAVSSMWAIDQVEPAIELERAWNELASKVDFRLLCGYPTSVFAQGKDLVDFEQMCAQHSEVTAIESYTTIAEPDARRRSMARIHVQLALVERERDETVARLHSLGGELQRLETLARDLAHHDEHLTRDVRGATQAIAQYLELLRDHHAEVPAEVSVAMIERARDAVEGLPEFIDRLLKISPESTQP